MAVLQISRPNARFQQWEALLHNRSKRQQLGEFIVQGVRPITAAIDRGWPVRSVIFDAGRELSGWATAVLERVAAERVAMAPDLLRRLSGKDDEASELLLVLALPSDDLERIPSDAPSFLGAVFDRPSTPGNVGTIIRSLDAFGGAGLIITGHATDPYDPKSVRASTGSLLAVPVVREASYRRVLEWARPGRAHGRRLQIVGTDENGARDIADVGLTGPTLLVVGNETTGLSAGWLEACDVVARIPMTGSASSLNAASAGTVALYEAARQRRTT